MASRLSWLGPALLQTTTSCCTGSANMPTMVAPMSVLGTVRLQVARRRRQLSDILAKDGFRGLIIRTRVKVSDVIRPQAPVWHVLRDDVTSADLKNPLAPRMFKAKPSDP